MGKQPLTTTAPTGQIAPFGLRMLPELREKIEEAARASGRSMNAEVVARLESSFGVPLDEFAQVQRLKRESLLRLRIDHLTVKGAAIAEGLLLAESIREEGGELTAEQRHALDELRVEAKEMIEEMWRASPEAAIQDLQAAVARAQALEKLAQPKAAAKRRAKR